MLSKSANAKRSRNNASFTQKEQFVLKLTQKNKLAEFPTMIAQQSLLNFDATEISQELTNVILNVNNLISSDDVKLTLSGLAKTSTSISKIAQTLDNEGFSAELVKTLKTAEKTTQEISALILDTRKTMTSISSATASLQKDASHSMQTFNNVSNKLQRDTSKALASINRVSGTLDKGLKSSLSEDSALQYRLQQLINNLSEASNSFSVLADTIQRKPNSVIFGK
jgi:paraquat-inducible protein B